MTKVTSQALYKKNIEIKEKEKKINESSDDFQKIEGKVTLWRAVEDCSIHVTQRPEMTDHPRP